MVNKSENKSEGDNGLAAEVDLNDAKQRFVIMITIFSVLLFVAVFEFFSTIDEDNQISLIEKNIASSSKKWIDEKGDFAVNTIQGYNKCVDGSKRGVKLSRDECLKVAGEEFYNIVKDAVEKSDVSESVKYSYMTRSD